MKHGDSEHEIITSIKFDDGAMLHRFNNRAGVPYSAIYYGGFEAVSNTREKELGVIEYYRRAHVPMRLEEQRYGKYADWYHWREPAAFAAVAKACGDPHEMD